MVRSCRRAELQKDGQDLDGSHGLSAVKVRLHERESTAVDRRYNVAGESNDSKGHLSGQNAFGKMGAECGDGKIGSCSRVRLPRVRILGIFTSIQMGKGSTKAQSRLDRVRGCRM